KAHFYVAELYYKKDLPENAQSHYEYVVSKPKGEYTEQALVKLSEPYLNASQWNKATPLLKRLETEADYPQNVIYAQSNLMNAYYQMQTYTEAKAYDERVVAKSNLETKVKSDAQIINARSAMKTGNQSKATTAYATV